MENMCKMMWLGTEYCARVKILFHFSNSKNMFDYLPIQKKKFFILQHSCDYNE